MARAKKEAALTPEERLQAALVPDWEWPYKLPENWCWLSNLKLRLSYGQTGNDNVSAYQTQGSISGAKYYTFGSNESIGYVPNNLRNLDLGWGLW